MLPESLKPLFTRAATTFDACGAVAWSSASGRTFEFRLCRPPASAPVDSLQPLPVAAPAADDRLGALEPRSAVRRLAVTRWLAESAGAAQGHGPVPGDALVGTLVHRLFQQQPAGGGPGADEEEAAARALMRPEERATVPDPEQVLRAALAAWRAMRSRDDVRAALAGSRMHEVPFSLVVEGEPRTVLRGTIDGMVRRADGSLAVVEFKTGQRRDAHQRQLDVYVAAVRAMYPGTDVTGVLLYAG